MTHPLRLLLIGTLLLSSLGVRAETHATCAGFIDSVPAVISTQGTWCLRHDLSTAITTGSAIEIATNNVTLDCNSFKVGGLAAGASSQALGIKTFNRQNVTIRNCNVRGFRIGVSLYGGAGHLVEDNRFDNNLVYGVYMYAESGIIQRNRIFDTGGAPGVANPIGISAGGDLLNNSISGVFGNSVDTSPIGILHMFSSGGVIRDNRIDRLVPSGSGTAHGINAYSSNTRVQGNHITSQAMTTGVGLDAASGTNFCLENTVSNFQTPLQGCGWSVGNLALGGP